ncbi:unnamed protein product [Lactuca virosa]|uniref:SKP1-like protein n=1 Tax=Lactuca virosa TaxID=75947 RepID=A0AAU9M6E0_9ASTR|nr:unnamed protein product [Lactuca virosa]
MNINRDEGVVQGLNTIIQLGAQETYEVAYIIQAVVSGGTSIVTHRPSRHQILSISRVRVSFIPKNSQAFRIPADQYTMSSSSKVIVLKSSDGETFEVEEAVALESQTIKHMIEDDCADTSIPLPNVTSKILSKVIEYCKKHVETPKTDDKAAEDDLKSFDAEFVKVDQGTLFDLILAANYLNIKSLLDLTCQTVADMIKGKTPEEIRKTFNIKNDFTPEEEEEGFLFPILPLALSSSAQNLRSSPIFFFTDPDYFIDLYYSLFSSSRLTIFPLLFSVLCHRQTIPAHVAIHVLVGVLQTLLHGRPCYRLHSLSHRLALSPIKFYPPLPVPSTTSTAFIPSIASLSSYDFVAAPQSHQSSLYSTITIDSYLNFGRRC